MYIVCIQIPQRFGTHADLLERELIIYLREKKLGAYAMKRVAASAHLPTPSLHEPAKRPHDAADNCLGRSFLP